MRMMLLAAIITLVAIGSGTPANAEEKVLRPGYLVIRVLLDSGNRPPPDPNNPNANPQQDTDPTNSVAAVVPYSYVEARLVNLDRPVQADTNLRLTGFKHKYGFMF